jgi:hypothetical protein
VVAASPDLLRVRARTPEQMRLANAFCRFAEFTKRQRAEAEPNQPAIQVLTLGLD